MIRIDNNELKKIKGGSTISASFINAILNILDTFMDAGRSVGSSIRRLFSKQFCPLK